jgi:hypothetical protein
MKLILFLTLSLFLWPSISIAQSLPRDALIDRVESIYVETSLLPPDSPMVEMFLEAAKSANPGVSNDKWFDIKIELATTFTKVMTEKGGVLDTIIRSSLESLSDAELDKLGQILSYPVFYKFQAAMIRPSTQNQLMQVMVGIKSKPKAAANSNLVDHGLKKVY